MSPRKVFILLHNFTNNVTRWHLQSSYWRADPRTGKPGKDGAGKILAQTRAALKEMRVQLEAGREQESDGTTVIYSPMFNSGAFKVPWESTSRLIEEEFKGFESRWLIMAPP
ncbi:hypothetical protein V3481_015041 [Fusarium oxysporum f. sp. vasinfectum]